MSFILKGEGINGELVDFKRGAKGLYGMQAFNYRIRIEYEGEMYIAMSIESDVSSGKVTPLHHPPKFDMILLVLTLI